MPHGLRLHASPFSTSSAPLTLDKMTVNEATFSYQDVDSRGGMVCGQAPLSQIQAAWGV